MIFKYIFIFLITINSSLLFAQFKPKFDDTFNNFHRGFNKAFEWYDVPIAGAYLYRNFISPDNIGDKIYLGPIGFEQSITDRLGNEQNMSLGSMDKDIIPNLIFHTRLAVNISLNLFTDTNINSENYQRIFLFKKSLLYTYVLTEYVKNLVKRTRPDGSDDRSFFSGHTSTTFAAATFLYKELHDSFDKWGLTRKSKFWRATFETVSFGTLYGWAGYVGYSRIKDKKHYLSDVLVGALVGTAISYFLYESNFGEDNCFLHNFSVQSFNEILALNFKLNIQ